jgi:hypothetical protein
MDDETHQPERDLPHTTTTGDDREDYRERGDSSVQDVERDDPTSVDPQLAGHREDDSLLPDREAEDEDGEDENTRTEDSDSRTERPSGNPTSRSYGD